MSSSARQSGELIGFAPFERRGTFLAEPREVSGVLFRYCQPVADKRKHVIIRPDRGTFAGDPVVAVAPVQPGPAGRTDPSIPSNYQKVVNSRVGRAESCLQGRARLAFVVDAPSPIDELREPTLEAARPPWIVTS